MKKLVITFLILFVVQGYSQKKKNGTIYLEHPAINVVNEMLAAWVEGDSSKVSSYLADDFKQFNGANANKYDKGNTKEEFLNGMKWWKNNFSYTSEVPTPGAYPDALEYDKSDTWVQVWNNLKAVNNRTGVKIDMPMHRMFKLNKDNKINLMLNYTDSRVFRNMWESYDDRANGTLYQHHPYINKVRRMIHAFEHNDLELAYSFFHENARFTGLEMPVGETVGLDEVKERNKKMMESFDILSIDVVGYPDYLEYDLRDGKTVQSWWRFKMKRKSDGKEIVLPALYIHDFNDDGKIVRSNAYISTKALDAK
ncbi:nuclear transport factor 2 family protein [uncultured Muriicola sp.]|uniref:nuclear transport factor 2 family protein n=1 Tax=uncultured Muriicola sp. TaxID=1583102 RepID=UPI00262E7B15|nr:nuclear transport factor 2 family protein [uncultured Muriicola sp.]